MKHILLTIICLFGLVLSAFSQGQQGTFTNPQGGNLIASSTDCSVVFSCVWMKLPFNANTSAITLAGIFSATALVEESGNNGVTFTIVATLSSVGLTTYATNGLTDIRVRVSAFTSGQVSVTISTGVNTGPQGPPGPAGGLPNGPTTPNTRAQVLTSTPTGGVAGPLVYSLPGATITDRASGESSYTFGCTDIGNYSRVTNASGETLTIPDGNTGCFVPPVSIGIIVQGGASTLQRQTASQIRCTPNGALANTCALAAGGQYILVEDSGFNYTLSVSGDVSSAAGCTSGCNYVLGLGDNPANRADPGDNLITANQGLYMRFFNPLSRKLGNACIFITTLSAAGHADVGLYSITGGTGTLRWHTGSFSTAATGEQCFTPAAYTLAAGASFYISWCADNTTVLLLSYGSGAEQINAGAGTPANTWGVDATDTCTVGVLPATITITNIANQSSRTAVPYVYASN